LLSLVVCAIFRLDRGSSKSKEGEVVSIADIESAERLVGIAYTAAERDQMVENLERPDRFSDRSPEVPLRQFNANSKPLRPAPAELPHAGAGFAAIFESRCPTIARR
jgi:hypothetical protein